MQGTIMGVSEIRKLFFGVCSVGVPPNVLNYHVVQHLEGHAGFMIKRGVVWCRVS